MKHCVIYVPGLSDSSDNFRRRSLRLWSIWGVRTIFTPMSWDTEKKLAPKEARLEKAIERVKKEGYRITLVGESAGATVAINAAAKHNLRLITICGADNPKMHIAPKTQRRAPALKEALRRVVGSFEILDLLKVHTITPLYDGVVSPKNAVIKGAHNHQVFSFGHGFTISLYLTLLSGYIVYLVKNS